MSAWLTIVGIGADGWSGLCAQGKQAIEAAELIVGGERHLSLVPETPAERRAWPSPMQNLIDELVAAPAHRRTAVLASGDPLLHGVGAAFARRLDRAEYEVIPHLSAYTLACARLGWAESDVALVSLVGRPVELLHPFVQPGRRLIVYSADGATPAAIATLLAARRYGPSRLTVLENLGGEREARRGGVAADWDGTRCAELNLVALVCVPEPGATPLAVTPGLPDEAFETDGQLTKREVRAATLARLVPLPGQLLWDVGAGTGSICIEWMRTHPSCRAVAFERRADRAGRILRNARDLGVPGLRVIMGAAPGCLAGAELPDAVFIGGGIASEGLVELCWDALQVDGRLVANAVTVEGEAVLARWQNQLGGELARISVARAAPVGGKLGWRAFMPVTQWAATKR